MMRRFAITLLIGTTLLGADASGTLEHPDPVAAGMDAATLALIHTRMTEFVRQSKTAGVVTVVARRGHVAHVSAVGYASLEKRTPMQADTLFRIASLTKPVTCAAIMMLADEGKLSVRDPVEKFLPEFKGMQVNRCGTLAGIHCENEAPRRPVNLEDLMTHTSGLVSSLTSAAGNEPKSLEEIAQRGAKTILLFDPGANWNYSNLGIDLLGRVVEVVSGESFDRFLHNRIFEPLGMKNTGFWLTGDQQGRMASLYTYRGGKLELADAEWGTGRASAVPSPAGGLISSAADLLQFNEMMRQGGSLDGLRILSPAAVRLMTISHTGKMPAGWSPGVGHGYGYEVVRDVEGMFRLNSLGTFCKGGAYRTYEFVDPEKELTGVILMQRTNGGGDTAEEINSFVELSESAVKATR